MADESVKALVLPLSAAPSGEPQAIADFPGRWEPGQPYLPEALGLTEAEARTLLRRVPTPLVWVDAADSAWSEFRRPAGSHAPTSDAASEAEVLAGAGSARPVLDASGDPIHPGVSPPPSTAAPWAEADRARATALTEGEAPPDPGREAAIAAFEEEVAGAKKAELLEIARGMELDADDSWLVDQLRTEVLAAQRHSLEHPSEPFATTRPPAETASGSPSASSGGGTVAESPGGEA